MREKHWPSRIDYADSLVLAKLNHFALFMVPEQTTSCVVDTYTGEQSLNSSSVNAGLNVWNRCTLVSQTLETTDTGMNRFHGFKLKTGASVQPAASGWREDDHHWMVMKRKKGLFHRCTTLSRLITGSSRVLFKQWAAIYYHIITGVHGTLQRRKHSTSPSCEELPV